MHDSDMMLILPLERHLGTVFVQYIFEMHECTDWPKKSTLTTTTTTDRDFFAGLIFSQNISKVNAKIRKQAFKCITSKLFNTLSFVCDCTP